MSKAAERLIALDGINGASVVTTARALVAEHKARRAAISAWDASGIFGEVLLAEKDAGRPCARTLLLLYAADLAFRLRWEIRPALAAGRVVIAAPYVDTAVAFGRAAGLDANWLADTFSFAIEPGTRKFVDAAPARTVAERKGFLEFGCQQMVAEHAGQPPRGARSAANTPGLIHLRPFRVWRCETQAARPPTSPPSSAPGYSSVRSSSTRPRRSRCSIATSAISPRAAAGSRISSSATAI
jgi:hypothetical protein